MKKILRYKYSTIFLVIFSCESHVTPISRLFYGTDLQRLWNGITTDLERTWNGLETEVERTYRDVTELRASPLDF